MLTDALIKQRIAAQFGRAAAQYDSHAHMQQQICQAAFLRMPKVAGRLLDMGCGTGSITRRLLEKGDSVLGLDLSAGMLQVASRYQQQKLTWLCADAEVLPLRSRSFAGVFSSMALQWCSDLSAVFSEIERVLKPGGEGLLAIMLHGSFDELRQAWQCLDGLAHVNAFPSLASIQQATEQAGLEAQLDEQRFVSWHQGIQALLHSVKDVGANTLLSVRTPTPLTRARLAKLESAYKSVQGQTEQLSLTYNVGFVRLRKPLYGN